MTSTYERGTSPFRIDYLREPSEGQLPSGSRSFKPISDNFTSAWSWEPDANTQRQDAAGEIEAQGFFNGAETHEVEFEYDLQQWFYDGSGNTQDPHGDFLKPTTDNALRSTHTIVSRSEHESGGTLVDNPTIPTDGFHVYTVGRGGHPDSSTIPFETEDGSPISVTPSYQFQKVRRYIIHQYDPNGNSPIEVINDSSTDVAVTIESEGGATSETVTAPANGSQVTNANFSNVDAAELATDVDGDVYLEHGTGSEIMRIRGSDKYPSGEGDLGVPVLNGGSRGGNVGGDYISFLDDELDVTPDNIPAGQYNDYSYQSDFEVVSGDLSVSTGLSDNAVAGDTAQRNIYAEEFEYIFNLSLAGEHIHVDQAINYLTEREGELTWTTDQNRTIVGSVRITSPGEYTKEAGDGKLVGDNEFEAVGGITVSNA